MTTPNHIMIVAGEASGDMHAALLVKEIRRTAPAVTFSGLGGQQMKDCGVELFADLTGIAVIGFAEVLKHYGEFRRIFHLFLDEARRRRPSAVILVDYPGFNLRLARELKKIGIPVIYYISPQVWAWKENRVRTIKDCVNRMLVLFQFEKDFYTRHGFNADFVGHPLVDTIKTSQNPEMILPRLGLTGRKPVIGLLPGSRRKEIERILPPMLESALLLKERMPGAHFLLIKAPTIDRALLKEYLSGPSLPLTVVEHDNLETVNACDICLVASGTATLEVGLLERPMVIVYRTSWATWALAKMLIKIPMIGLVNIVAGKKIVPELIQGQATPQRLADEVTKILSDKKNLQQTVSELHKIRALLGESGAVRRAADVVAQFIQPG